MKVKMIEKRQNGVCLFELQNDEIKVITSNLGCHILSVFTKDRDGNYGDVVSLDIKMWKIVIKMINF